MTDRLTLYNDALLACGERFLASLTVNEEPRRLLDQVWSSGGIKYCLERGLWNFATRTQEIDYDSGIEPSFGYNRAFNQPTDWCCTKALASDEFFTAPLLRYVHEGQYFYSDQDTIYLRYISTDPLYGMNLNVWPETFREVVAMHFAAKIALKIGKSKSEAEALAAERDKMLREAKNADAQREPTQFPPPGAWTMARRGFSSRRDGGNSSGNLIG